MAASRRAIFASSTRRAPVCSTASSKWRPQKAAWLPAGEQQRYGQFVQGFHDINGLRQRLGGVSDHLRQFAPKVDERYTKPKFETDWHDVLLDLGISALKSGITSVLTIGSGRGEIFGAWSSLGITEQGHNLGHMEQPDNPIWIKIRQYNCRMLVELMEQLESVPEGSGTMMDNTLIVYTSNNADKQHTAGATWPVMLLGNCNGVFSITQSVFESGRIIASVKLARARYDEQLQTYTSSVLTAFREVETALAADAFLREQATALRRSAEEAERAESLALGQYEKGLTDVLTLLDTRQRAFDSSSALIAVQAQRLRNRADLHLALGGGF